MATPKSQPGREDECSAGVDDFNLESDGGETIAHMYNLRCTWAPVTLYFS